MATALGALNLLNNSPLGGVSTSGLTNQRVNPPIDTRREVVRRDPIDTRREPIDRRRESVRDEILPGEPRRVGGESMDALQILSSGEIVPTRVEDRRVPGRTTGTQYPNFPLKTNEPLAPPTLAQGLDGPVQVLLGEESLARDTDSRQGSIGSLVNLDYIAESSSRTACNGTSQLSAIICNQLSLDPRGSVLSLATGNLNTQGCLASRYGCCSNGITRRLNNEGSNCTDPSFQRQCLPFGCCPNTSFGLRKANLIGTNCPNGAVPLIGWDGNSNKEQLNAAGFGYKDPRYRNNNNLYAAGITGQILSQQAADQLINTNIGEALG